MECSLTFILFLSLSLSSLLPASSQTTAPLGTIERTTKQQVLVSIPPYSKDSSAAQQQPFLTSPSGKYTGYLLRRITTPGAGGFGNDFCYVEVVDASSGTSAWESDCAPVSTANACSLVFDDAGIEVFDGSTVEWGTSAESSGNNPLHTLELVDEGDMRIRDSEGELAWKASDEPRSGQRCGSPGSPGLAPAMPPFASPIGAGNNHPFGQQQPQPQPVAAGSGQIGDVSGPQQQHQGLNGVSQTFGLNSQPLVDNTPFNSGVGELSTGVGFALVAVLMAVFFF